MLSGDVCWSAALQGLAAPGVIALALALTTLLLEDVAIAAGVALAAQGSISWALSIAAVAAGIALGDLGLYALGCAGRRVPGLRRRWVGEPSEGLRRRIERRLGSAVLLARVVPGLRLLTYTASGFARVPLLPFTAWVVFAVLLWTGGLYLLGAAAGQALAQHLGLPAPLAVALPILVIALLPPLWRRVCPRRRRFDRSPS